MSKHVFFPKIGLRDKLFGYKPRACECDVCGAPSTRFVCPHCNNWLPTEMIEKGSEIISVIGGPASGKSNYIVALIQQLQKYGYKLTLGQILPARRQNKGGIHSQSIRESKGLHLQGTSAGG